MSIEYDNYLNEHIANVQRAMNWMFENVPVVKANCPYMSDEFYGQDHDQSKYSDKEYAAYDNYFYGGNTSYGVKTAFDYAWLHHQNHNKHHWQYWVLIKDDPDEFGQPRMESLEMPFKYVIEMIADWWSFSWRNNNLEEIFTWYEVHGPSMLLHPKTRDLVNFILDQMHRVIIMQLRRDGKGPEDPPKTINILPNLGFPAYPVVGEIVLEHKDEYEEDKKYGVPELKKFPMPTEKNVRSAIKFFNYVGPEYEEELARNILARMKEYGMSFDDFTVGDENRFKKYIPEKYLEHTGVKGMHWGERNGPPYPLNSKNVAEKIYKDANKKVSKITEDVLSSAKKSGGHVEHLENNLKSKESIERKINKKVNEDNLDISEAANKIKDAVRYTIVASDDNFVKMYNSFKEDLALKGYEETDCQNYFDKFNKGEVKHKAVQSNFATNDGYEFEVQFHTPASQDAKDKKIPLYNERRSSGVTEERKRELEKQMEDLALKVPDPAGIETIQSHGRNNLKHSEIKEYTTLVS